MKKTILYYKRPVLIAALGILVSILAGVSIMLLTGDRERSYMLIYQVDTKVLSESEIEDMANKYLIPTLKQQVPEKDLEFNWQHSTDSIQVSTVTDSQTIRKLREFNKVIELQLPAYVKQIELVQRSKSTKALQQLRHMLMKYIDDNDGKLPDSLSELKQYDVSGSLPWLLANIQYFRDDKALSDLRKPIAYDKRLLQKGNGTNVLFFGKHVGFFRPEKLEELGIFPTHE